MTTSPQLCKKSTCQQSARQPGDIISYRRATSSRNQRATSSESADWGIVDCRVLAVEPNKTLSYTWAAYGLASVVTWTLTPTSTGTHLRMEQSGFRPDQQQAYQGAKFGWQSFFGKLEQVLEAEEKRA